MLSVRPSTKICGVPQDFVVQRDDLEYQSLVQPQALQSIALAVAEARSVNLVLQRIVEGLAGQPETALARIWLRGPGDLCSSSCRVRAECPDQTQCLHLRASAGRSVHDSGADWTRLTEIGRASCRERREAW